MVYMQERRRALGGVMPTRSLPAPGFKAPGLDYFSEWTAGSNGRAVSTTMGFVSVLRHLLKNPEIGQRVVPIVPDEGRTFGMESVIRQVGIYAPEGQRYTSILSTLPTAMPWSASDEASLSATTASTPSCTMRDRFLALTRRRPPGWN